MSKLSKEISRNIINIYKILYSPTKDKDTEEEKDKHQVDTSESTINTIQTNIKNHLTIKNIIEENTTQNEQFSNTVEVYVSNELNEQNVNKSHIINTKIIDKTQYPSNDNCINSPSLKEKNSISLKLFIKLSKNKPFSIKMRNFLHNIRKEINSLSNKEGYIQKKFEIYILSLTHPIHFSLNDYNIQAQIIDNIKTSKIKFPSFRGPFLVGSFKRGLYHSQSYIDILFTCQNIKQLYEHNNYILKELITSLFMNIIHIEQSENIIQRNNKSFTRIELLIPIKNSNIKVKLFIIDVSIGENDSMISDIALRKMPFILSAEGEKQKVILCQLLRIWRKKWKLNCLLPEILDEIVDNAFYGSVSTSFLKILYLFHTKKIVCDEEGEMITPKYMKKRIKEIIGNDKKFKKLEYACKETALIINNGLFSECFETQM